MEPSCNVDMIVEKQLKNSMNWKILLKMLGRILCQFGMLR